MRAHGFSPRRSELSPAWGWRPTDLLPERHTNLRSFYSRTQMPEVVIVLLKWRVPRETAHEETRLRYSGSDSSHHLSRA